MVQCSDGTRVEHPGPVGKIEPPKGNPRTLGDQKRSLNPQKKEGNVQKDINREKKGGVVDGTSKKAFHEI